MLRIAFYAWLVKRCLTGLARDRKLREADFQPHHVGQQSISDFVEGIRSASEFEHVMLRVRANHVPRDCIACRSSQVRPPTFFRTPERTELHSRD